VRVELAVQQINQLALLVAIQFLALLHLMAVVLVVLRGKVVVLEVVVEAMVAQVVVLLVMQQHQ
jgi:hypothetical protein